MIILLIICWNTLNNSVSVVNTKIACKVVNDIFLKVEFKLQKCNYLDANTDTNLGLGKALVIPEKYLETFETSVVEKTGKCLAMSLACLRTLLSIFNKHLWFKKDQLMI